MVPYKKFLFIRTNLFKALCHTVYLRADHTVIGVPSVRRALQK